MNKFNTVYTWSRMYVTGSMYGGKVKDQPKNNTDVNYERRVFRSFKQEVQMALGLDVNTNTWIFEQNLLKTIHTGKDSLRSLCETFYYNQLGESLK